jgi:HEAT repeat protein
LLWLISTGVAIIVLVIARRRLVVRTLRTALKRGDSAAIVKALGRAGSAAYELVPQITPLAASPDVVVRRAAIRALVPVPGDAAERVVRAHLADPDPEVRSVAASRILGDQ